MKSASKLKEKDKEENKNLSKRNGFGQKDLRESIEVTKSLKESKEVNSDNKIENIQERLFDPQKDGSKKEILKENLSDIPFEEGFVM